MQAAQECRQTPEVRRGKQWILLKPPGEKKKKKKTSLLHLELNETYFDWLEL